jgi:hypothetical protein
MDTKVFQVGEYTKTNNVFYYKALESKYIKYTICSRKAYTKNKPENYIIGKIEGKDYYLSSMYPTAKENVFKVEFKGVSNQLIIKDNDIIIK